MCLGTNSRNPMKSMLMQHALPRPKGKRGKPATLGKARRRQWSCDKKHGSKFVRQNKGSRATLRSSAHSGPKSARGTPSHLIKLNTEIGQKMQLGPVPLLWIPNWDQTLRSVLWTGDGFSMQEAMTPDRGREAAAASSQTLTCFSILASDSQTHGLIIVATMLRH